MKTAVTVRFISGREETYEMDLWDNTTAQARLQGFAENPKLVLQTNDEVIIIPGSAIESISIKLPKGHAQFGGGVRLATRIK
jgi:hypothetical protein